METNHVWEIKHNLKDGNGVKSILMICRERSRDERNSPSLSFFSLSHAFFLSVSLFSLFDSSRPLHLSLSLLFFSVSPFFLSLFPFRLSNFFISFSILSDLYVFSLSFSFCSSSHFSPLSLFFLSFFLSSFPLSLFPSHLHFSFLSRERRNYRIKVF